jgi:hypothetical protein
MAKTDTPKVFTVNKAQKYLAENGIEVGTQQVRNLARTNEIIMAGVTEYTDQVSDETYKVITQTALDNYIAWKRSNPEVVRGRKGDGTKRYSVRLTTAQLTHANVILQSAGLPGLEIPIPVKRGPRKPKNIDAVQSNGVADVSSDVDLSELELIEVAD